MTCRLAAALLACVLVIAGLSTLSGGKAGRSAHRKLGKHIDALALQTDTGDHADNDTAQDDPASVMAAHVQRGQYLGRTREQVVQRASPAPKQTASKTLSPAGRGLYALHAKDIDGADVDLAQFAGRVLLIVNVASECGFTESNYQGLQALYAKYGKYGLDVLAFPCNQFGEQEPGSEADIKAWAAEKYGVTFRLMAKADVNGDSAHPVFKWLKRNLPVEQGGGGGSGPGKDLVWNFNKFLVDRKGNAVAFYTQQFDAPQLETDVHKLLQQAARRR